MVDMSEPKAEDWIVDVRGFMLATVIGHYKQMAPGEGGALAAPLPIRAFSSSMN